jgi:glycosyltransferase involved in cell wall biosynthesis
LKDILRDRENGFIIPPDNHAPPKKKFNPQAVADAIERLVETPELHERISTINWRYARHRFAAPVVARRLEALCRGLLSPAASERRPESAKPVCVE